MPSRDVALVTGCAGFLGSHLGERLVADGHEVIGVDCLTDYYPRRIKRRNLASLLDEPGFTFRPLDLSTDSLDGLLAGVDVVYHLAAQPGVRGSFGAGFERYVRHNIHATQRLLEEAAARPVRAFVYASSSAVYGDAEAYPTPEDAERRPVSPYGMTKLAAEELARVYLRGGVPVVGLRYFTIYGPRQRPDMAISRFVSRASAGAPVEVFGDGQQVRELTYVDDAIEATLAAARLGRPGAVYNVGGGTSVRVLDVLRLVEDLLGCPVRIEHHPPARGDARRTSAEGSRAARELGFVPATGLVEGLGAQIEWMLRELPSASVGAVSGAAAPG